jgi:ArsR family transcriptional regulator
MADIFDVIADGTRRDLLRTLLDRHLGGADAPHGGEISVGELVVALGLSQPTVSKHLKVLRDIRLVTVREQGQHRFYSLDPTPLGDVGEWLVPFLGRPEPAAEPEGPGAPGLGAGARRTAHVLGSSAAALVARVARLLHSARVRPRAPRR